MTIYAKGIYLQEHTRITKEGEEFTVIKMGIHRDDLVNNAKWNKAGWSNFEIRFAQGSHRPYAVVDIDMNIIKSTEDPKPKKSAPADEEEIPF